MSSIRPLRCLLLTTVLLTMSFNASATERASTDENVLLANTPLGSKVEFMRGFDFPENLAVVCFRSGRQISCSDPSVDAEGIHHCSIQKRGVRESDRHLPAASAFHVSDIFSIALDPETPGPQNVLLRPSERIIGSIGCEGDVPLTVGIFNRHFGGVARLKLLPAPL